MSTRLEKMAALFKNANWTCPNCGEDENTDVSQTCINCGIPKDPNNIEHISGRVWGELEALSHYLHHEVNKPNQQQAIEHMKKMVGDIKQLLFFNSNAPFKKK